MSWLAPNLARTPFENLRPLRRISLSLAVAALALTVWNVGTWLRTGAGAAEKAAELERLGSETEQARARTATLEAELRAADLEAMNEQVEFLNRKIAERTFSWNDLLDDLVDTLPPTVRIRRLSPQLFRQARARRQSETTPRQGEEIRLALSAEAEDGDSELELIDHLFAHPRFETPDPGRDSTGADGLVQFDLSVLYRPRTRQEAEP